MRGDPIEGTRCALVAERGGLRAAMQLDAGLTHDRVLGPSSADTQRQEHITPRLELEALVDGVAKLHHPTNNLSGADY